MTKQTGRSVWTGLGGLSVPKLTRISRDCGEMTGHQGMKELGASNMDVAAQPVNQVMPISLQPVPMQTGFIHWIGE